MDTSWTLTLADADYSVAYLVPLDADGDPYQVPETLLLMHHVNGADNTPISPMPI